MHKRTRHVPKETDLPDDRIPARSSEGVVITVYVESPSLLNRPGSNGNARRRRNGPSRAHECFDRHAQLLAYSRDLRRGDAASREWPRSYTDRSPKREKRRGPRWFTARKKFRLWFDRMCSFRIWPRMKHGYKRVDRPADDVKSCGGNKKGFPFPSKLKFRFPEIWWGCSRSSGR